jgi:ferredoxin
MALYIDANECTACGDCEPLCPTQSIHPHKGVFAIKADTCMECEGEFEMPQCQDVCEVDNCILPLD